MLVKIERLSIQGDGIAEGPVYVPFSLPGEIVEGHITGNRIERFKIIENSPDRASPPCSHYGTCGGCALQHATDEFVAHWKADVVRTALEAQNLTACIRPTITSPTHSRRRASFTGRRTKKTVMVGFHGRASDVVTPVAGCHILHPGILDTMPMLEALTKIGASRKGSIQLSVTWSINGADITVSDAKEVDRVMFAELARLSSAHKIARLSWNGETVVTFQAPVQSFGTVEVTPPPNAFLQATDDGQKTLIKTVQEAIGDAKTVADLFAGCGTFSFPLAEHAQILAVEGDEILLAALDAATRHATGLKDIKTAKRDLFRNPLLPEELEFDAVVIDPPRAGAKAQCEALATSQVRCIAFVSCNPVTFARDAKLLVDAGYQLEWVQPIDQFRWSPHVELVALLRKS